MVLTIWRFTGKCAKQISGDNMGSEIAMAAHKNCRQVTKNIKKINRQQQRNLLKKPYFFDYQVHETDTKFAILT